MKRKKTGHPLKYAADRIEIAKEVVRLRDVEEMSWQKISYRLPDYTAVPTVCALYNQIKGEGAHHGRLPGKGGRLPDKGRG